MGQLLLMVRQELGRLTAWRDQVSQILMKNKKVYYQEWLMGFLVEIYMERVRDLFDPSKDNLQIKESKVQGIFVSGVTKISVTDSAEALRSLSKGIANKAVGETQMNMASSRIHCVYIFVIQQELKRETRAKHIKVLPRVNLKEDEEISSPGSLSLTKNDSCERILEKLRQNMKAEDVQLLEQLFILESIFFDPNSAEEVESAYEDVTSKTILSLQKAVKVLSSTVEKLKRENQSLRSMMNFLPLGRSIAPCCNEHLH